jgi:hypothetical protein
MNFKRLLTSGNACREALDCFEVKMPISSNFQTIVIGNLQGVRTYWLKPEIAAYITHVSILGIVLLRHGHPEIGGNLDIIA